MLAFLAANIIQIKSQPYCDVRTFSLSDGLAANAISSIGQTNDDMMWFGTWNGLCFFDGYRFTTYRDMPGDDELLSSNRIISVRPDFHGDVWVVSYDHHLYLFDTRRCKYISIGEVNSKFRQTGFRRAFPLSSGYTWVAVEGDANFCLRIKDDDVEGKDGIKVITGFRLMRAACDGLGREWLFTDKGLRSGDGRLHTTFPAAYMADFKDGTCFVSQTGQMVWIAKGGNSFKRLPSLGSGVKVNDVHSWRNGLLLATTRGLFYASIKNSILSKPVELYGYHKSQTSSLNPQNIDIKRVFVDSRQRLWLFTAGSGLVMINNGKSELLQAQPLIPSERTTSSSPFIHEDGQGTIWTVPNGGTFCYYDEASHRLIPYPLHNGEMSLTCIPLIKRHYSDSQHNLWITGERNLTYLNFRSRRVQRVPVVDNQEVRAVYADRQGNIWAGDHEGVLAVYDRWGKLKGYMSPSGSLQSRPSAFAESVYSITQDSRGRMWIGSKMDGLFCIDNGRVRHFTRNGKDKWSLNCDSVYDIMEDANHRIWIATYGGGVNLLEEKAGGVRFININNIFSGKYPRKTYPMMVRRLTRTCQGVIIAATNGGLITFAENFKRAGDIRFYTTTHRRGDKSSLTSNTVLQALVTRKGIVYVNIMGGGVQEIVDKNLLHDNLTLKDVDAVTTEEGLVQAMVEDKDGYIWLVRESTIDKYDARQNHLYTFSSNDLGYNVELSEAKPVYNIVDGRILMACNGSFISFAPRDLVKSSFVPKIAFISVQFQGETEAESLLNIPELDVPSGKRSLTIYFSALDYSDNRLIRYAYKLDGSDDKWNYVGTERSASFNRLPYGHLKLLVRSTNADGVWQNNTRVLNIYAHPTFWESWMGWLLYIITGGIIVFIVMYIYAQRQRIKMQDELSEMRSTFFTNIGHKLRTPLTLIGGPVTEVLNGEKLSGKGHELLEMVKRNSENMLGLVNSMLNYENNPDNYLVDDSHIINGASPASPSSEGEVSAPSGENLSIKLLVVEDNRDLRQFLFSILSSDYSVLTAENGQVGLEKARKEMPDFIISDVMMPVMDGLTMVHELKQDKNTSHIPIIILSAKASMKDRLQGLREGIDDYITKPFSATYLKERVANIITRRKSLQQEVLSQLSNQTDQANQTDQTNLTDKSLSNRANQSQEFRLKSPEIIDEDKVMMEKLMAFLEEHIDDSSLKMEDMAQAVNLGRTVFYGKMKSIVGMAPIEFVRHVRLQRAEELVAKSKENFSQIAYAVGFADPKYFSKCFKKETGMSPSEYRERFTS